MDTPLTASSGKPTAHTRLTHLKPLRSILLIGTCLHAYGQTNEPASRDRIIFEPRVISVSPSEAYSSFEDFQQSAGNNPVLDEAGIISTPERAVYVNRLEQYEDQINQLVISEGIYSANLIDNYLSMATIYDSNNQLDNASEAYDSALQLIRIEHGLEDKMQLHVLEENADVLMRMGRITEAGDELEKIRDINADPGNDDPITKTLNDLQHAESLYELAEYAYFHRSAEPVDILNQMLTAKLSYRAAARYFSDDLRNHGQSLNQVNATLARMNYFIEKIIIDNELNKIIINGEDYLLAGTSRDHLRNSRISRSATYESLFPEGRDDISDSHEWLIEENASTKATYENMLPPMVENMLLLYLDHSDNMMNTEDPGVLADSMMNIADWGMLLGYNYRKEARQIYNDVYEMLQESELVNRDTLIDQYFYADTPVQVPSFIPPDYSLESYGGLQNGTQTTLGFIDVSFRVDRNGHAKRVKAHFRTPTLSKEYEELLIDDISGNQYRPAFDGSKPVRKDYSLRYYVSELE